MKAKVITLDLKNIDEGKIELCLEPIGFVIEASLYYFALDGESIGNLEDGKVIYQILSRLVNQWRKCLQAFVRNFAKVLYLPFEFKDEYIGFIRIQNSCSGSFAIDFGFSEEIQGHSISPSSHACFTESQVADFVATSDIFQTDFDSLKESLDIVFDKMEAMTSNSNPATND